MDIFARRFRTPFVPDGFHHVYLLICVSKIADGIERIRLQHAVEREYQVINALSKTSVPVPKALVLCEDSSVIGTPFYVMQYLRGRIFKQPLLPEVGPEERMQIYKEMNRVMAALHSTSNYSHPMAYSACTN
jgi:aminoglycoside phosphotransferase (APT) family kinase protein